MLTRSSTSFIPRNSGNPQWAQFDSPHAANLTPDEQIENYQQWRSVFLDEFKGLMDKNCGKAIETIEKLLASLATEDIIVLDAYLKINHPFRIGGLILVSEDDYLDDNFRRVYELSRALTSETNNEYFNIELSFAAKTEYTDEDLIFCDGYTLKRSLEHE